MDRSESVVDIEDLKKALRPKPSSLPLTVEVTVFDKGRFLSEKEIENQLISIIALYPDNVEVLLSYKLSNVCDALLSTCFD